MKPSKIMNLLSACFLILSLSQSGEADEIREFACIGPAARSQCLKPTHKPGYYVEQSKKYFYTMETSSRRSLRPNYSELVARWEWEPWLLLTGYGRFNLVWTNYLLSYYKTKYDKLDCRFFDTQPFGRCHVVFNYNNSKQCPIYEEFTFNDAGEMTFIEAWTDYPEYLPMDDPDDYWAQGEDIDRLSTKIPGLGAVKGLIDPKSRWMEEPAAKDPDVADFMRRARSPYRSWIEELKNNHAVVEKGCDRPVAK